MDFAFFAIAFNIKKMCATMARRGKSGKNPGNRRYAGRNRPGRPEIDHRSETGRGPGQADAEAVPYDHAAGFLPLQLQHSHCRYAPGHGCWGNPRRVDGMAHRLHQAAAVLPDWEKGRKASPPERSGADSAGYDALTRMYKGVFLMQDVTLLI